MKKAIKYFLSLLRIGKKYPYQKLSFSQCGEDMIIHFIFNNLLNIKSPTYLDIGAHHPFFLSNTAFFYLNNKSRGINIEPDVQLIKLFHKFRKKDINLNIAISENNEKKLFYIMSIPTLNTFSLEEAQKNEKIYNIKIIEKVEIETYNLEFVLKKYNNNKMPDLLSIDVEGYEFEIFKTIDLYKYRPKVICIESYDIEENTKVMRVDLINYITNYKYKVYADTGMNAILIDNNI